MKNDTLTHDIKSLSSKSINLYLDVISKIRKRKDENDRFIEKIEKTLTKFCAKKDIKLSEINAISELCGGEISHQFTQILLSDEYLNKG